MAVARSCKAERHNFSVQVAHSLVGRQTHKQMLTVHYSMINAVMVTYTGDTWAQKINFTSWNLAGVCDLPEHGPSQYPQCPPSVSLQGTHHPNYSECPSELASKELSLFPINHFEPLGREALSKQGPGLSHCFMRSEHFTNIN